MFNSIFGELKEVTYFTRNNIFQESFDVKYFIEIKCLKSLEVRAVLYLESKQAFMMELFVNILNCFIFSCNKSSIIDVQLGYIQAFNNIEIFKVKLRWSKSSQLLQGVAIFVFACKIQTN